MVLNSYRSLSNDLTTLTGLTSVSTQDASKLISNKD